MRPWCLFLPFLPEIVALTSHDRRAFLTSAVLVGRSSIANAADLLLEPGLLDARVSENLLNPPPYGMEANDISYPSWLAGVWTVESTTQDVLAPCGVTLFGGNATYQNARKDIGTALRYESRFVQQGTVVVADRAFNVQSIAKAAIGPNSVVDIPRATPNQLSCILAPPGAPSLLQADLLTLNRRQEVVSDSQFDCSEVVREIVAPVGQRASPSLLKEIETISLYTLHDDGRVTCRQRSAAFLLPSQQNPMAQKLWEASQGRAVDVRYYDLVYQKR